MMSEERSSYRVRWPGWAMLIVAVAVLFAPVATQAQERVIIFSDDFENVMLGPNVDESLENPEAWTRIPPPGWSFDSSGVPGVGNPDTDGCTEWAGWSFADATWWTEAAGDQRRTEFTVNEGHLGEGVVVVVDPDEWDDCPHDDSEANGWFQATITTPPFSLAGIVENTALLTFDSSWRPEFDSNYHQSARITASFDGGDPVTLLEWLSDSNAPDCRAVGPAGVTCFKDDESTNETIDVPMQNPAGVSSVVLTFEMFDAGNDWWWAIDNVVVTGEPETQLAILFSDDFENVQLGPNVDESLAEPEAWTRIPPPGWSFDSSGVPGVGNPDTDGCTEWAGWSFANATWWTEAAGDQRRSEFTVDEGHLGEGVVVVVDPDEWDDCPHDDSEANGWFQATITTPPFSLAGIVENTALLTFDSSWRPEFDSNYHQSARITASFDGGDPVTLLEWLSDSNAPDCRAVGPAGVTCFKDDESTNETIPVPLNNPAGASSVVLTFEMFDAGNDWWWAIDNVLITGLPEAAENTPASFAPGNIVVAAADTSVTVGLVIPPACGSRQAVDFSISSSDDGVASASQGVSFMPGVSLSGVFELNIGSAGTATLTTANNGACLDGTATVEVLPIDGVLLRVTSGGMEVGDTQNLLATGTFGAAGERNVTSAASGTTYSSNAPNVVTVNEDGVVTAVGVGMAEITAENGGNTGVASILVAEQLTKIAFIVGNPDLGEGDQAVLDHLTGLAFSGDPGQIDLQNGLPASISVIDDADVDAEDIDANVDLVLVSSTISPGSVGGNFRCHNVPMVFWASQLHTSAREGVSSGGDTTEGRVDPEDETMPLEAFTELFITDNSHPITQGLGLPLNDFAVVYDSPQFFSVASSGEQAVQAGALSPDVQSLAEGEFLDETTLATAESGTRRVDGSPFLGRRVSLWFSDDSFDNLNDVGLAIFENSIDWALDGQRLPLVPDSIGAFALNSQLCPPSVAFGGNDQTQLRVTGSVGAGCTSNLTSGASGTIYTSSNEGVAVVGPDGLVTAIGNGSADITIENGGLNTAVSLVVSDQPGDPGFIIETWGPSLVPGVASLSRALDVVNSLPPNGVFSRDVVNFVDSGGDGEVAGGAPFPNFPAQDNNDFVMRARGLMLFETLDPVTLRVNTDDGFGLFIDGTQASAFPGTRGAAGTSVTYTPPRTGLIPFEVIQFERGGGASAEFTQGEGIPIPNAFSPTPPAGWTVDNSALPAGGVTEWRGWTFVDPDFWWPAAGDQRRAEFVNASGVMAIADPDEWDDLPRDSGSFNSFLTSPPIDLGGAAANTATVTFDSSWRPDSPQTATISVSYDGAEPIEVLRWESDANSPFFKDDNSTNERPTINLNNPAGATSMTITFGLTEAGNDWWWAIDNIEVAAGGPVLFAETFDSVTLGPSVDELDVELILVNDPNEDRAIRVFQGGCPDRPVGPPPELVSVMGSLGASPDAFISPLGEDVAFDTVSLELSAESTLAAGAGITLVSNGGGDHTLTLDTPVAPGECRALSFDVADATTGVVGSIAITLCHLPLDVNQDGQVTIGDITAWGNEFNSSRDEALVDTNGDGNINVQDATAVGNNWFGRAPATKPWFGESLP